MGSKSFEDQNPRKAERSQGENDLPDYSGRGGGSGCRDRHHSRTIDQNRSGRSWNISTDCIRNRHALPGELLLISGGALVYVPLNGPRLRWWRLDFAGFFIRGSGQRKAPKSGRKENQKRLNRVVVRFATFGGASVLASRLVSSLAPPKRTTTLNRRGSGQTRNQPMDKALRRHSEPVDRLKWNQLDSRLPTQAGRQSVAC